MDDKLNALDKLIEAVEKGTTGTDQCSVAFPSLEYDGTLTWRLAWDSYNGDLNAFSKFLNMLLPEWRARLDIGRRNRCWVISPDNQKTDAYGSNPAQSGLLAVLKAYRSVQA